MAEAGGAEGCTLPDFGRIEDSGAAAHYYLPTQIFRPCATPELTGYSLSDQHILPPINIKYDN